MDEALYRFLKWTAIVCAVVVLASVAYTDFVREQTAGVRAYKDAERLFEDGFYERALGKYEEALAEAPADFDYLRATARTLMQLGRIEEAEALYGRVIAMRPDFGAAYANRGILLDRTGRYDAAIRDYERAMALDPELDEGPGWLSRFLRLQPDKPPTIGDRARYLRAELAKPQGERVLRVPQADQQQRTYKQ